MSAILVEQLSKRYIIGHETRADNLRDALGGGARALWSRLRRRRLEREEFWALRDINFSVEPGEVVGIIGRNGAGKSTLLKILSRITEPTTGRISLHGRVASLLEVGTGFHPELSGRENIFLNGAILGMSRTEIRKKFDEIVAFAEVERFLDTPVKRYSSGMYVRLAFAVAAHLEPEILIVDEVLAVGDAQFQKKCLGKMREVARGQGRTVLFVSHNMPSVQALCSRAVLLASGRVAFAGGVPQAISHYLRRDAPASSPVFHGTDPAVRVDGLRFATEDNSIRVDLTIRSSQGRPLALEFILSTSTGTPVAFADRGTLDINRRLDFRAGETAIRASIDASAMANGAYTLRLQLVDPYAHIVLAHELPQSIEVSRAPASADLRVLDLNWQAGAVELKLNVAQPN